MDGQGNYPYYGGQGSQAPTPPFAQPPPPLDQHGPRISYTSYPHHQPPGPPHGYINNAVLQSYPPQQNTRWPRDTQRLYLPPAPVWPSADYAFVPPPINQPYFNQHQHWPPSAMTSAGYSGSSLYHQPPSPPLQVQYGPPIYTSQYFSDLPSGPPQVIIINGVPQFYPRQPNTMGEGNTQRPPLRPTQPFVDFAHVSEATYQLQPADQMFSTEPSPPPSPSQSLPPPPSSPPSVPPIVFGTVTEDVFDKNIAVDSNYLTDRASAVVVSPALKDLDSEEYCHSKKEKDSEEYTYTDLDLHPPPPKPTDDNAGKEIEAMCDSFTQNDLGFECITCQKESKNPECGFLFGGEVGSEAAVADENYKWVGKKCPLHHKKTKAAPIPPNTGSLTQTSFKEADMSPSFSDMEMEDEEPRTVYSHMEDRYEKLKTDSTETAKFLTSEYEDILKNISREEVEEESRNICLSNSKLGIILAVLYCGKMLYNQKPKYSLSSADIKRKQRIWALIKNEDLTYSDISLMIQLAAKLRGPHSNLSHSKAIETCICYTRKWIGRGTNNSLCPDDDDEMQAVKATVKKLMDSDFFKSKPSFPFEQNFALVHSETQTLAYWLENNKDKILYKIKVHSKTVWRLSWQIRAILRSILSKLREFHQNFDICEDLKSDQIYLDKNRRVYIQNVKRNSDTSLWDDFESLVEVIKDILSHANATEVPRDVELFLEFIRTNKGSEDTHEVLYNHPCSWSTIDVIKHTYLFAAMYTSSERDFQLEIEQGAVDMKHISGDQLLNWRDGFTGSALYSRYLSEWETYRYQLSPSQLEILFFMRDAYPHLHEHVPGKKKCLYSTENELFAYFPTFIAEFAERTEAALSDVYWNKSVR